MPAKSSSAVKTEPVEITATEVKRDYTEERAKEFGKTIK